MPEWLTANWIWIVLALGVAWLLVRSRGACCGAGGHGYHREPEPRAQALDRGDHGEPSTTSAGTRGSGSHGGCC